MENTYPHTYTYDSGDIICTIHYGEFNCDFIKPVATANKWNYDSDVDYWDAATGYFELHDIDCDIELKVWNQEEFLTTNLQDDLDGLPNEVYDDFIKHLQQKCWL